MMRVPQSLTRRQAIAALAPGAIALHAQADRRKNVLFILADDLNTSLSIYGNKIVKTPNFERLAKLGVTFDRAYCQYPLCQPSRTSLLSGLRPATTRVYTLETPTRQTIGETVMLPELFRRSGYFTAHAGKIFHTGDHAEDPRSWDIEVREKGKTPPKKEVLTAGTEDGPKGHTFEWDMLRTSDSDMPDGTVVHQTIEWLEARARDRKPFFIGNGFRRPHAPYAAPQKYFDLYRVEDIPLPNTSPDEFRHLIPPAINFDPPDKPLTDLAIRQHIRAYYACVSFVDAQLGKLLDAMDRLGLWENTIVALSVDHGYHLGEHGGLWHKMSLFEEATRVPMLMVTPGMRNAGKHSKGLVESVDLYPTITELCGLRARTNLEGSSLRPLLENPERAWKRAAFSTQGRGKERGESANDIQFLGQTIRTERWRYTEWDDGKQGFELYDKSADPREVHNLANTAAAKKDQAALRDLLHNGWKAALPA
jgi:uncharacterized sulfatase